MYDWYGVSVVINNELERLMNLCDKSAPEYHNQPDFRKGYQLVQDCDDQGVGDILYKYFEFFEYMV